MGRPESSSTLFIAPSAALDKLDYIGAATVADAILDRLLNGAHRLQLIGDSMRRSEEVSKTALRRKLKKLTDRDRLRYVLVSSEAGWICRSRYRGNDGHHRRSISTRVRAGKKIILTP